MSQHAYPGKALAGDYARAGVGLSVTAGPALLIEATTSVVVILTALAALFGIFGLRTALRQATVVKAGPEGIECRGPIGRKLAWRDVKAVKLDYFATRRGSAEGWMQMKISGRGGSIRVDSSLEGFPQLASAVAAATSETTLRMSDTTLGNFRAIGIEVPGHGDGGEL